MRIVSMVPSWTETLMEAGADVVGRSRFCIHPEAVKGLPAIGGTKNWDTMKLKALRPDLILLDREENTKEMGEYKDSPILVTHVRSVHDVPGELRKVSAVTGLPKLQEFAGRLERAAVPSFIEPVRLPGVIDWIRKPEQEIRRIVYIIWKNPWMAVSQKTFIGSMLELFVPSELMLRTEERYPKIDLENFDPETTLLLFSTEPYPFAKQRKTIGEMPYPSALVDGESWSWFGVRSLRFLESARGI